MSAPDIITLGRQFLLELYGCDPAALDDLDRVRDAMLRAAVAIGATYVGDTFHRFAPQGVSGSVVIAESHLSIHTWPELAYAAVDIFTCGGLDPTAGLAALREAFGAEEVRSDVIVRGRSRVGDSGRLRPFD